MAGEKNTFATVIGADAVLKGNLHLTDGAQILGKIEGELEADGELFIGEGGSLHGDARAQSIHIDGHVNGNVKAAAKVQLGASARLEGDLETARLEVSEGAVLVGHCTVGIDAKSAAEQNVVKTVSTTAKPNGSDSNKSKYSESRLR